jgi:predicted GNAT family acetyltransferase
MHNAEYRNSPTRGHPLGSNKRLLKHNQKYVKHIQKDVMHTCSVYQHTYISTHNVPMPDELFVADRC